jgi:hypothetical protein
MDYVKILSKNFMTNIEHVTKIEITIKIVKILQFARNYLVQHVTIQND